jgi:hypothetical protein
MWIIQSQVGQETSQENCDLIIKLPDIYNNKTFYKYTKTQRNLLIIQIQ